MNNKTLKRVVALLATALLVCSCAFAAEILNTEEAAVTYDATSGEIVVPFAPGTGATKAALLVKNERTEEIVALAQFNSLTNVVAFEETIDTEKVAAGDKLLISVGDNAAESTSAATAEYTVPVPVVKYTVTYGKTVTEYKAGTEIAGLLPTEVPTKEATEQYTYTFAGWLVNGVAPVEGAKLEGNIEITAAFTETVRTYAVKFVNEDGTELQNTEVAYGETPVYAGETPAKAGDAQYSYNFTGWTPALAPVTGEATYTAQFEQTVNSYTVTWVVDGVEETATYEYGAMPTHADPVKDGYTFKGWTPEIVAVVGDATYTAEFEEIIPEVPAVKVTFVNGTETTEVEAVDGVVTAPAAPTAPTPGADALISRYEFVGWTDEVATYAVGEEIPATEAVTLYAKYQMYHKETNKVLLHGDLNADGNIRKADANGLYYYYSDKAKCDYLEVIGVKIDATNLGDKVLFADLSGDGNIRKADANGLYYYYSDKAKCDYLDIIGTSIYFVNK